MFRNKAHYQDAQTLKFVALNHRRYSNLLAYIKERLCSTGHVYLTLQNGSNQPARTFLQASNDYISARAGELFGLTNLERMKK